MTMHALAFDHPEQRVELASNRDRFRIQNQGLDCFMTVPILAARWTLNQGQGDAL